MPFQVAVVMHVSQTDSSTVFATFSNTIVPGYSLSSAQDVDSNCNMACVYSLLSRSPCFSISLNVSLLPPIFPLVFAIVVRGSVK